MRGNDVVKGEGATYEADGDYLRRLRSYVSVHRSVALEPFQLLPLHLDQLLMVAVVLLLCDAPCWRTRRRHAKGHEGAAQGPSDVSR